jgi:hypothetical protein
VLLNPKRAARLNQLAAVAGGAPNFPTVLDALFKATWVDVEADTARDQLIVQQTQRQMVDSLLLTASEPRVASAVRAESWDALNVIKEHVKIKLAEGIETDAVDINNVESWRAHYWFVGQQIAAAASADDRWRQAEGFVPPGSPI